MLKKIVRLLSLILLLPVLPILGAIKVKSAADTAKKWNETASGRGAQYEAGVTGAGQDWAAGAAAAGGAYKAAVQSPNIQKMFEGGIKKAGAEKYTRKATGVGKDRYGPGITAAVGDYQTNIEPYLQVISGLTLTPRQPRGSTANITRVTEVATALNKRRLAVRSAGG